MINRNQITCPECKGLKGETVHTSVEKPNADISYWQPCYYCAGTGYQAEELDEFVEFWKSK
jgi:DnaJ-class molecular chaperone